MRSDLLDLTCTLHAETARAALVSDTGEEARAVWLPKSKIEIERTGKNAMGTRKSGQTAALPLVIVTLPAWLAVDKGLA